MVSRESLMSDSAPIGGPWDNDPHYYQRLVAHYYQRPEAPQHGYPCAHVGFHEMERRAEAAEAERDALRAALKECQSTNGKSYGADWQSWRAASASAARYRAALDAIAHQKGFIEKGASALLAECHELARNALTPPPETED